MTAYAVYNVCAYLSKDLRLRANDRSLKHLHGKLRRKIKTAENRLNYSYMKNSSAVYLTEEFILGI